MCRHHLNRIRRSWRILVLALAGLTASTAYGDVPRLISYQGRLQGFGAGPVDLQIRFYDSPVAGIVLFAETHAGVPLNAGVFSILIGSPTVGGVPDSAFVAAEVWLGLTVNAGSEYAPRTRVVTVPFAAKASGAERLVRPGSFDAVAVADENGNLRIEGNLDVIGPVAAASLNCGTSGMGTDQGGAIELGDDMGIDNSPYIDFHRGVGAAQDFNVRVQNDADHRLSLFADVAVRDSDGRMRMNLDANNGRLELIDATGNLAARLSNPDGKLELFTQAPGAVETVEILAAEAAGQGAWMELRKADETTTIHMDAESGTGALVELRKAAETTIKLDAADGAGGARVELREADGTTTVQLDAENSDPFGTPLGGSLQIRNDSGQTIFHMGANYPWLSAFNPSSGSLPTANLDNMGGFLLRSDASEFDSHTLLEDSQPTQMKLQKHTLAGQTLMDVNPIPVDGVSNAAVRFFRETNTTGNKQVNFHRGNNTTQTSALIGVDGVDSWFQIHGGNFGIGTSAPEEKLHVIGGTDTEPASGGFVVIGSTSGTNISIDNNEIMARNNGDTSTLFLNNDGGNVQVPVLVITGGADFSEKFDVRPSKTSPFWAIDESAVKSYAERNEACILQDVARPPRPAIDPAPGFVVCIDPAHPGELVVSSGAYDRTVAGIISGAGGVKPGMLMGQAGSLASGEHAVALTGRVYCQCDASNGSIQPGDLLTTSAIPGHAMKVTDHAAAQGAIIGKALTSLESGRGLVLVLVSLQ